MKPEAYESTLKLTRIGNRAVRKAQAENRKHGLPSVYSRNNRLYYELPDGTFTNDSPFAKKTDK